MQPMCGNNDHSGLARMLISVATKRRTRRTRKTHTRARRQGWGKKRRQISNQSNLIACLHRPAGERKCNFVASVILKRFIEGGGKVDTFLPNSEREKVNITLAYWNRVQCASSSITLSGELNSSSQRKKEILVSLSRINCAFDRDKVVHVPHSLLFTL